MIFYGRVYEYEGDGMMLGTRTSTVRYSYCRGTGKYGRTGNGVERGTVQCGTRGWYG